jgi:xanthine dehydrogenase molybdenum-binding subunit
MSSTYPGGLSPVMWKKQEKLCPCGRGSLQGNLVAHCCLGTSGHCSIRSENNLTFYSITQIPSLAQRDYTDALAAMGLQGKKVRVIKTMIGGGFGSKLDTYAFEYIAILLAHRTHKPVKIVFSREEEFFATSPRQPAVIDISQGCTKDGRLTFRDIRMILDNGAYTSWGATTPSVMMMPISSLYKVPNVRYVAKCVYTNNTYSQAMRVMETRKPPLPLILRSIS